MDHFTTFKIKFTNQKTKIFKIIFSLLVFALMLILAIFPDLFLTSFLDGLILFATAVLPATFPFMFLTKTLTDLGMISILTKKLDKPFFIIFRAPAIGLYLFFMSAICGYPVGAKILSDLVTDKAISKEQAEQLLPFCSTSGPLFVVGTVGVGFLGNKMLGFIIFGIHLLACIIGALILGWARTIFKRNNKTQHTALRTPQVALDEILAKNMTDTCSSVLLVGGFIASFYLLIDILTRFKILWPIERLFGLILGTFGQRELAGGLASGLVEMTRGCRDLSIYGGAALPVALTAIITFSGLSILMQTWAFLSKAKISFGKFLGIKILQTAIATLLALLVFCI